jgi:hypothetical protein
LHPDLENLYQFRKKSYSTFELADFIKMNRHYFENKEYDEISFWLEIFFEGKIR